MGAHGSPAAGYKILYTNWRFHFIWCLHRRYVLSGKLILQFPFYLVCVHVSDVETEVAFLCPMSGLSAAPAGVRSGLGLPCHVYVHRDRVTQGRVGVGEACGGRSQDGSGYCQRAVRSGSWNIGLSVRDVERLVCHAVLIHPDCETEPGFRVCIQRSSVCHSPEGRRDPTIKASAEFDHNGFQVGVSGIINQVPELVEVVINRPLALKVGSHLQDVDGSSFRVERHKVLSEFFFEVQPVDEAEVAGLRFLFKFMDRPAVGTSSLHTCVARQRGTSGRRVGRNGGSGAVCVTSRGELGAGGGSSSRRGSGRGSPYTHHVGREHIQIYHRTYGH